MSCAACSARVEKAVKAVDGVAECNVSLLTNSMTVEGNASPDKIIKAVVDAGYGAEYTDETKSNSYENCEELKDAETPKIKQAYLVAGASVGINVYINGVYDVEFSFALFYGRQSYSHGIGATAFMYRYYGY